MSMAATDSPNGAVNRVFARLSSIGNRNDEQSSTWVNSFNRLNSIFSGSLIVLGYRFMDIVLLSLGLYYGTGTCSASNPLAIISICLLIFDGIDLAIVLFFLVRNCVSRNESSSDEERLHRFRLATGVRLFFLSFKLIPTCAGTAYAFKSTVPINTECEIIRFCLGIVCFSTWAKLFMPLHQPPVPVRRSTIVEYFIALFFSFVFNGVYFGIVLFAAIKTQDPACIYTNIEDLYFRAPLKLFAYVGLILIGCRSLISILAVAMNRLFFLLPSWRTTIFRLMGVHYALSYLVLLTTVYYFSVGAVLLFQPRSGGSCRSAAPNLYKTLLIWEWICVFLPVIVFPLVFLLICLGILFGTCLAYCLPASITVPILEALREWVPQVTPDGPGSSTAPNPPATPGTIDALPMVGFSPASNRFNQTECAICRADFETNEQVKLLQCGHLFHANCVANWLSITRICPVCRRRVVSTNL